jgi:hypothetical protein
VSPRVHQQGSKQRGYQPWHECDQKSFVHVDAAMSLHETKQVVQESSREFSNGLPLYAIHQRDVVARPQSGGTLRPESQSSAAGPAARIPARPAEGPRPAPPLATVT